MRTLPASREYAHLEAHLASCRWCRSVGGLDCESPTLHLCVAAIALLRLWERAKTKAGAAAAAAPKETAAP